MKLGAVKGIADYAFYRCDALDNITLPGSLEIIGRSVFGIKSNDRVSTVIEFQSGDVPLVALSSPFSGRNMEKVILDRNIQGFDNCWGEIAFEITIGDNVSVFPSYLGGMITIVR